jgi:hypothetical protein
LDEASDDEEGSVDSDEKMDADQDNDEIYRVVSEGRNDEQDGMSSEIDDDDGQSEMMVKCVNITVRLFGFFATSIFNYNLHGLFKVDEELTEEDRRVELERLKAAHAADEG